MRVGRARVDGREQLVVVDGGQIYELAGHDELAGLIGAGVDVSAGRVLGAVRDVPLLAPWLPRMVIAVGLNYGETVQAMGLEMPRRPLLFSKLPSSVVGPQSAVRIDETVTRRVDWEVELGVVIGRPARAVTVEQAMDHVFGYVVANDLSARDLQESDGQWLRAKSLDTFCPVGPAVVTRDEVADPQQLHLRAWVNGELVQDGSTADMIFGVAELVSYCSQHFTLAPGDLVLTGTPPGSGEFRSPRRHLHPGDVVEVEVEGLGRLRNPVEAVLPGA